MHWNVFLLNILSLLDETKWLIESIQTFVVDIFAFPQKLTCTWKLVWKLNRQKITCFFKLFFTNWQFMRQFMTYYMGVFCHANSRKLFAEHILNINMNFIGRKNSALRQYSEKVPSLASRFKVPHSLCYNATQPIRN